MLKVFDKIDKNKKLFILINIIWWGLMFFLTKCTPLYSDDTSHALISGDLGPVKNFSDMILALKIYYFGWGGRVPSYFIFQYLIVFNRPLYDILNPTVYTLFALVIYRYAFDKQICNTYLVYIYSLLWIFTPSFGGSYLWLTGSVTYLWFMLIMLIFAWHYYKNPNTSITSTKLVIRSVVLFILGILAGWSIEAAACTLSFSLFVWVVMAYKQKRKISVPDITGIVGFFIGFGLLMFAPGNFVRGAEVSESSNIAVKYLFRIARETYYSAMYMTIPFGIAVALFVVHYVVNVKNNNNDHEPFLKRVKRIYMSNAYACFFLVLAIVSIYVMTFSSAFANRIFITPLAMILISIGLSWQKVYATNDDKYKMMRICGEVIAVFLVLYCFVQIATAVKVCSMQSIPIEKYLNFHYPEAELGIW